MNLAELFQNEPMKAVMLLFIAYVIIMIPILFILFRGRKKKAESFLQQNKDAAVVCLITKGKKEELASSITVHSVNGKKPVFIDNSASKFYVQPGTNVLKLKAEWREFSLLARGNSKYIGSDATIEITAEAKKTYTLKFSIPDEKFIVGNA